MTDNPYGQNPQPGSTGASGPGAPQPQPSAYHAAYGVSPEAPVGTEAQSATPSEQATQPLPSGQPYANASAAHASGRTTQTAPSHAAMNAAQAPAKPSSAKTFLIAFAGALVACLLAFGVAAALGAMNRPAANVDLGASTAGSVEATEAEASLAEAVADKCLPSVASITVYSTSAGSSGNPLYDYFNGGSSNSGGEVEAGLGSGVVLSEDGYVITNNHVVSGGTRFAVTIEGETHDADLVGTDASSDVAILKVKDVTDLTPIEVADSDNITIGEWVMSIGSPFGLEQSVATGIISATSRSQIMDASEYPNGSGEVVIYPNLIQTDAAINPGNSGGALVDANGQLVGINTLITSYSGNYSGVGFAIPANYAMGLAKDIISGKEPTHAQLGVSLSTVNASISERYGFSSDEGAYVSAVTEGSGAAEAGIQKGDIVVGFDGQTVSSASDLMMDVRTKAPGDVVTITVNRDGETMDFQVTLGSDEASQKAKAEQQQQQQQQQDSGRYGSGTYDPYGLFGN